MELKCCGTGIPSQYELQVGIRKCIEISVTSFYEPSAKNDLGGDETFIVDLDELTKFVDGTYKRGQPKLFIKSGMQFYGKMTKIMEGRVIMIYDTKIEPILFMMFNDVKDCVHNNKQFNVYKIDILG
jgi:hypothetical protein